jgi:hypothetical protein
VSKITKAKRAGSTAKTVEHLPRKYKVLSSNSSTAKNERHANGQKISEKMLHIMNQQSNTN